MTARALAVALAVALLSGCDANPFDEAEVPVVTVQAGAPPSFTWAPDGAQLLRVYRGDRAGDGYGPDLVWSVAAADGRNGLRGPVAYGVEPPGADTDWPPRALGEGQTYTVEVRRFDAAGSGDGFTNTRNDYVGTATFVAE